MTAWTKAKEPVLMYGCELCGFHSYDYMTDGKIKLRLCSSHQTDEHIAEAVKNRS